MDMSAVPPYSPPPAWTDALEENQDSAVLRQIVQDGKLWDSVFKVIEWGEIEILEYFINLGFDINAPHPQRNTYSLMIAVESSQTKMIRNFFCGPE